MDKIIVPWAPVSASTVANLNRGASPTNGGGLIAHPFVGWLIDTYCCKTLMPHRSRMIYRSARDREKRRTSVLEFY